MKIKTIVLVLLLALCTSTALPAPAYASALNSDGGKSIITTLTDLLFGSILGKLLHSDTLNNILSDIQPAKTMPLPGDNRQGKDVLGFYAEWWDTDTASYKDLVNNSDTIGTIAPFWASLHGDGSVSDRGGNDHASVVKYAHNNKITALLMINNAKQDDPNAGIHAVLSSPGLRTTAIDNIEAYMKKYGLDGVNIDFESVPADDRDALTAFMTELSNRLRPQGYLVTIDVIPKHNEDNDFAAAYDYAKLAQCTDKIMLMTYDYHGTWSDPGSVADIRQTEADLKYALTLIPKNKVYLGIAGYGYDWSSKGVESLEFGAIQKLINKYGADVQWDDASKAPHFKYTDTDGVAHQVWYESAQSLQYKLNLVNTYDIAGIALWKLSEEDPASWQVIRDTLKR